jgi:hypothetical protein
LWFSKYVSHIKPNQTITVAIFGRGSKVGLSNVLSGRARYHGPKALSSAKELVFFDDYAAGNVPDFTDTADLEEHFMNKITPLTSVVFNL